MITKEIDNIKICYHKLNGNPVSKTEFMALSKIYSVLQRKIHITDIDKADVIMSGHKVNITITQSLKEEDDIIDYFIERYSKMDSHIKFISYINTKVGTITVSVMKFEFPINLMLRMMYK